LSFLLCKKKRKKIRKDIEKYLISITKAQSLGLSPGFKNIINPIIPAKSYTNNT